MLKLAWGRISFLLPGDIEEPVERRLAAAGRRWLRPCSKAPIMAAKLPPVRAFWRWSIPEVVVISVGQDNDFGHPAPEVLERYAEHGITVFRMDEQGTVEFSTDGERLWVETGR